MSRGQRLSFLGIAAVIAVVAVILLAGGGDDTDEAGTPASTATATSTATADTGGATAEEETPTPKPKPVLLQAGKEKALDYEQGETVRFRVRSDEAEEVHVHGYDIKKELEPGKTETVSFRATIPGIFRIELEQSQTLLAQLKVVP
jgi:hypothetical protein